MWRLWVLVVCLSFPVTATAQTTATFDQWYAHCLNGQLRIAPATPRAIVPLPSATNVPLATTLTIDSLCAVTVDWYFGTAAIPPRVPGITGFTYAPMLAPATKYYWKVLVRNGYSSINGPTWSFTTAAAATAASVTVAPASNSILVGGSSALTATVKDASGQLLPSAAVLWSSAPAGLVTLAASGQSVTVTGVTAGTATITATSGTVSGSASVTVATQAPPLTASAVYSGLTRDVVARQETPSTDGQKDAEFLLTLSASVEISKIVLQSVSSSGGIGTWDTVNGNGTWLLGVAAFATGPLITLPVTGASLALFATDGATPEYFPPGTVLSITVTVSDGRTALATVTIPASGGPPPCDAPCVTDPVGLVQFTASPDHAIVTGYTLDMVAPGAPSLTKALGKPIPDSVAGCGAPTPCIAVTLTPADLAVLALNTLYTANVTVTNADGSAVSLASNPFMRTK